MDCNDARNDLTHLLADAQPRLIDMARRLIRTPSENPPGDTAAIAAVTAELLSAVDGAEVTVVPSTTPIVNVVARLEGAGPGRRLIFNGHLDTFPATWRCGPTTPSPARSPMGEFGGAAPRT